MPPKNKSFTEGECKYI